MAPKRLHGGSMILCHSCPPKRKRLGHKHDACFLKKMIMYKSRKEDLKRNQAPDTLASNLHPLELGENQLPLSELPNMWDFARKGQAN